MGKRDGVEKQKNTNGNVSVKVLKPLLFVLGIVVFGLIVVVVVVNTIKQNDGSNDNNPKETIIKGYTDNLERQDISYQISSRISEEYNNGNHEEALKMFEEELNKALNNQDYELYIELIIARSTMLTLDGTCEELMSVYDNINIDIIPNDYRTAIEETIINDSVKCGDNERESYWRLMTNE